MSRKRVLVAMSGGVDSSVAACLLHEQGYDVVGVFMRLGAEPVAPVETCSTSSAGAVLAATASRFSLPIATPVESDRHRGCCSALDAGDARSVAARLGIPFYSLNFQADFARLIDYFADEYAAARTPNPCVRCNQWLKFGRLMEYADVVEADLIATGHYARIVTTANGSQLARSRNREKDQAYVLFGIGRATLDRVLFPLGDLTKEEVRGHARRFGLAVHDKPESQDICFVPDRDYARVVTAKRPDAMRPGEVRHVDGRLLGSHEGLAHFTIGQRRGLRIAMGEPIYVTRLDAATDTVYVGPKDAVESPSAHANNMSWLAPLPSGPIRVHAQIRYNHTAAPAVAAVTGVDTVRVDFDTPQTAVTPGQALVLFDGDTVLGGGWIENAP